MSSPHYTAEFRAEAIKQIVERGYSVADVSKCLASMAQPVCLIVRCQEYSETLPDREFSATRKYVGRVKQIGKKKGSSRITR